jgi:uncharacterized LabA/DUF88 family protein
MIGQFVEGKVYVFIDAENLFYTQRTLGWKISYEKLRRYFKKECGEGTKCFVYKGVDEFNAGQKKFLDMLDIHEGHISRELLERAKFVDLRKLKKEISQT